MFDIGFWEISLIMVVALLVLGPERLPRAARTAGLWFGRARGIVATMKADIDKELRAQELKEMVDKGVAAPELEGFKDELSETIDFKDAPEPDPEVKKSEPDQTEPPTSA